jgi:hypothetical protein
MAAFFARSECVQHFIQNIYHAAVYRACMRNTSNRDRQVILSLWALLAVAHANLTADLTGRAPKAAGITQLGRDMVRRASGEVVEQRLVAERAAA